MNNPNMKKQFRGIVSQVIKNNGCDCTVWFQNIDTGTMAFANMRGVKASWGRKELVLYTPGEISFTFPYQHIYSFSVSPGRKQIDFDLTGRELVSIRGIEKGRKG